MMRHAVSMARALVFLCSAAGALVAAAADASTAQDVRFRSEGVQLSGTLFMPEAAAADAALVLVHGSAKKDSLRMNALARALANDGFAVFTYDKRGIGKSQGMFQGGDSEAALTLLAKDAVAAVEVVAKTPRLQSARIGLLGISQGGWVGPIAAAQSRRIVFMLLWSGPVCSLSEELHFSELGKKLTDFSMHEYSHEVRNHMRSVPHRSGDFDPVPILQRVSVPTLWIFGARDRSIPVELSIERLEQLIAGGKSNFQYRLVPDGGHSLSYPDRATLEWMRQRAYETGE